MKTIKYIIAVLMISSSLSAFSESFKVHIYNKTNGPISVRVDTTNAVHIINPQTSDLLPVVGQGQNGSTKIIVSQRYTNHLGLPAVRTAETRADSLHHSFQVSEGRNYGLMIVPDNTHMGEEIAVHAAKRRL